MGAAEDKRPGNSHIVVETALVPASGYRRRGIMTQHLEAGRIDVVERPETGRFELDFPGGQAFAIYRLSLIHI